jgi:hypothetical protein
LVVLLKPSQHFGSLRRRPMDFLTIQEAHGRYG